MFKNPDSQGFFTFFFIINFICLIIRIFIVNNFQFILSDYSDTYIYVLYRIKWVSE
jgi:hypothetical protein